MSNKPIQRINSLKFSRILKRNKTISQINVTPMVDVMLVLLVIFMITAPLLKVGVPINLPKTKAKALPEDQTPWDRFELGYRKDNRGGASRSRCSSAIRENKAG